MRESRLHLQIERELGGIEQRLKNIDNGLREINDHLSRLNGRVGKNEIAIAQIKSKAALIASFFGTVMYFAWDYVKNKLP